MRRDINREAERALGAVRELVPVYIASAAGERQAEIRRAIAQLDNMPADIDMDGLKAMRAPVQAALQAVGNDKHHTRLLYIDLALAHITLALISHDTYDDNNIQPMLNEANKFLRKATIGG